MKMIYLYYKISKCFGNKTFKNQLISLNYFYHNSHQKNNKIIHDLYELIKIE